MPEINTPQNPDNDDSLSGEVFEADEQESPATEEGDGRKAGREPLSKKARIAVIAVALLIVGAIVLIVVSAIGLVRGSNAEKSAKITCDQVERVDIGGPADDFTVTVDETTGTSLKRDGTITSTESSPGEAVYEGIDPKTGKKVSGDLEYTAGHISWSATDGDTSYLQISKCTDGDGNVTAERKLQIFVVKDAEATSDKSISISTTKD